MLKKNSGTRTTILEVALKLFLQKGYKDVSYQDLVIKTGLSKGAIYHHFKSKKDILISAFAFLLKIAEQPIIGRPENQVKDYESFKKIFIDAKIKQIKNFKRAQSSESLKLNKLLFFLEAINENEKLKKTIELLLNHEKKFLEGCFQGLKKHNQLPGGKDPVRLAKGLFWMLQGTEMILFFVQNNQYEKDIIKMYDETLDNFFKII